MMSLETLLASVLMCNGELGIINSSEVFHTKKLQKKGYVLPLVSLFYFLVRCGGRLPHEVLSTLFYIFT